MRVLVVEDFEILARTIGTGLCREAMAVDVVLDRDLPGTHGDEVCRRIVAAHQGSRVLMLTASSTVKDRVDGLGLGADDYLPKPFDFAELVARIRALARRPTTLVPPVLEHADLTLDPGHRVASRGGRRLELNPKEFAVLECLLAAADGARRDRRGRGALPAIGGRGTGRPHRLATPTVMAWAWPSSAPSSPPTRPG